MIDFPNSPTVGQQFTAAGGTWVWDGVKWSPTGTSNAFLPLVGGTLTGPLTLNANPTVPLGAVPKQYVDTGIAALPVAMNDNRVINGDMRIAQRGVAGGTTISVYTVDRWLFSASQTGKLSWQPGSSIQPQFPYQLQFASQSAYTLVAADFFVIQHCIEADMISDFAWGTSQAQPVTLSFWAQSSITGTFGGSIVNYASTRSYPFTFSIPGAGIWTKITITIPGDTGGTWVMSGNGGALTLNISLGMGSTRSGPANAWASANYVSATGAVSVVGTNGAGFGITGVKLEIGSIATPFNRQSLAKSMADCQRYYQAFGAGGGSGDLIISGYGGAGAPVYNSYTLPVAMRVPPTVAFTNILYSNASALYLNSGHTTMVGFGAYIGGVGSGWVTAQAILNSEL